MAGNKLCAAPISQNGGKMLVACYKFWGRWKKFSLPLKKNGQSTHRYGFISNTFIRRGQHWIPRSITLNNCGYLLTIFWRSVSIKLGIPVDRVPTSKTCVFCIGMDSFFPIFDSFLVSSCWKDYFLKLMCCARRYKLGSEKSQSSDCCGFTNLLYKSLKCHEAYFFERIKQLAEEAISNI